MNNPLPFLIPLALLTACGPSKRADKEVPKFDVQSDSFELVTGEPDIQDIALFLSGRPVRHGAGLSRMQRTADYRSHCTQTKAAWNYTRLRVKRMRGWTADHLRPLLRDAGTVHYPFGGPDLLYAHAMIPDARTYVLMGLEPVGQVPALESLSSSEVLAALPPFRKATSTQLRVGYFVTQDMRADLNRSVLRGVTPILLSTVALAGGEVESAEGITVGDKHGVKMRFRDAAGRRHTVFYLNCDLSNGGFDEACRQWLAGFPRPTTYFKAASYLMHNERFSNSRNFFLSHSRAILQDDSGIPFRHFGDDWSLHFFGTYRAPIPLFANHAQADLREAYAAAPACPQIPFGSGYHTNQWQGNLMLAIRR